MEARKVRIDSDELATIFDCPVCYCEMTEPMIATCGHTFCKVCIETCLDNSGVCPECKRPLDPLRDLTKNYQVERIQRYVNSLKTRPEKEALEQAVKEAAGEGAKKMPIVESFQEALTHSILNFEEYCGGVKGELDGLRKRIKARYQDKPDAAEEARELAEVDAREKLAAEFLVKEYREYMKKAVPDMKILPLNLVVQVPTKGLRLENVRLKPYDTMKEVKALVLKEFDEVRHDPVAKWDPKIEYAVLSAEHMDSVTAVVKSEEEGKISLSNLKISQGSTIEVRGIIICESELPKPCITFNFRKEDKKACDYYVCHTCSSNWICEFCIKQCHAGHDCELFLKSHVPNRACCYCLDKLKNCKARNKNSPPDS